MISKLTPNVELLGDTLYVPMKFVEEFALTVSFPQDDTLFETTQKYVRTMMCVGVLYHFVELSLDQRRAWTNALDECLRGSRAHVEVMTDVRNALVKVSEVSMHRAFGSSVNASAFSLDKRVREELGVTDPGSNGTGEYALKILRDGLANETIPSKYNLTLTTFIEEQFKHDDPGMDI